MVDRESLSSSSAAAVTPFADAVWTDTEPVRILGMPLTATMAVVRLGEASGGSDARLLLYSPLSLTPARRTAIDALGTVAHLYVPNLFHHLYAGDWAEAYPSARVHAPPGMAAKRADLRVDRVHATTPEADFSNTFDEIPIEGFRLEECVLVHRPSKTLLAADLVQNVGRPKHPWAWLYTKTMGFYDRVALSRVIRSTAFPDKAAARRSVEALLTRPFDRVIVGHGRPIRTGGRHAIASAYRFLGISGDLAA